VPPLPRAAYGLATVHALLYTVSWDDSAVFRFLSLVVSLYLSLAAFPHYCTDPDVTWANARGAP